MTIGGETVPAATAGLRVFEVFPEVPFITAAKARYLYDLVSSKRVESCLELGFAHGKSSAVIAEALDDSGRGHLTSVDYPHALDRKPNLPTILGRLALDHRVSVRTDPEGFHWTLMAMLEEKPRPQFDFVFFDGAHTWSGTGFAFLLVEKMLKPGAWVVFDDLDWTIKWSLDRKKSRNQRTKTREADYSERELVTPQVNKVWDLLVTEDRYGERRRAGKLAIAQRR